MNRNFALLVPKEPFGPDVHAWATVTQTTPLRIRLDGETDPIPWTPDTLVAGLVLGNRVLVLLWANPASASRSHRLVIKGKSQ